jgi:hypothetical protein
MCPRCGSLKSKIMQVGSKTDMNNRLKLARVDNAARRFDIEEVRKMLFEKGINITSIKIDRLLGPISAVPTHVGIFLVIYFQISSESVSHFYTRMPSPTFQSAFSRSNSISIAFLSRTFFMNSNSVFGRPFSLIFFGFFMRMGMIPSIS